MRPLVCLLASASLAAPAMAQAQTERAAAPQALAPMQRLLSNPMKPATTAAPVDAGPARVPATIKAASPEGVAPTAQLEVSDAHAFAAEDAKRSSVELAAAPELIAVTDRRQR